MKPFDYNKYLQNNRLLKEMDEAKNNEDELWFSNVEYFRDEHKGYKLKPTDKVSVGNGPIMTYADAVKKYASKKIKEGDMEESFKDRIGAKRKDAVTPKDDMAIIYAAIKKEAGKDYKVYYGKDGAISVLLNVGGYVIGQTLGVRIVQDKSKKFIKIGFTNNTEGHGGIDMRGIRKFDPKDIDGILEACADMLQQVEDNF